MRSVLALAVLLLVAGCGRADPGTDQARSSGPDVADLGNPVAQNVAVAMEAAGRRRNDVLDAVEKTVGGIDPTARVATGFANIGGDEREEALVYLADPGRCGSGGCSLLVLTPAGKGWRAVGETSVTRLPVHRLRTSRDGWNDLAVGVGGGGEPSGIALLRFTGGRYPSNPSVQPILNRLPEGARLLIADDPALLVPVR